VKTILNECASDVLEFGDKCALQDAISEREDAICRNHFDGCYGSELEYQCLNDLDDLGK
jgi:hypothetical protein